MFIYRTVSNDNINITVNSNPSITLSNDTNVCQGSNVNLIAGTSSLNAVYHWSNGAMGSSINVSPYQTTQYNVTITSNGCSTSSSITVFINSVSEISLGNDIHICKGESVDLTTTTSDPAINYLWDNGSNLQIITVTPSNTTTYSLTVTDGACYSADNITVFVHDNPQAIITGDTDFCENSSTRLTAGGGIAYQWSNGQTSSSVEVNQAGRYFVTVFDVMGCSDTSSKNINIIPTPSANLLADHLQGCAPLEINLDFSSDCDTCSVLWQIGSHQFNNTSQLKYIFEQAGNYSINVQVSNTTECTNETSLSFHVFPNPIADFTSQSTSYSYFEPNVQLTNTSSIEPDEALMWFWDFGDDVSSNDKNPSHIYTQTGQYWVSLMAISNHGCVDSAIHPIEIVEPFRIYFPSAITPESSNLENRFFYPKGIGANTRFFSMMIYDRWGEVIFKTGEFPAGFSDLNQFGSGWNGRYENKGDFVQNGLYVYQVYVVDNMGIKHEYTGTVTVIR